MSGDFLYVVLAGNDPDPALLGGVGQRSKFCMAFGDERVGDRMIRALCSSTRCRAVSVAAPPGSDRDFCVQAGCPVLFADQSTTSIASATSAVSAAQLAGLYVAGEHVLIVTGDLPLITGDAIDCFLASCEERAAADCYMGMVDASTIDSALHTMVEREGFAYRGRTFLHADVYLVRPSAFTPATLRHLVDIVSVRRTGRSTVRGFLKATGIVLRIVGIRGLVPFLRVIMALPSALSRGDVAFDDRDDKLAQAVLELIHRGLGLTLRFVLIGEPVLAYGFDLDGDLRDLVEYDRNHEAGLRTPQAGALPSGQAGD